MSEKVESKSSILQQINNELKETKKKQIKGTVKTLVEELIKARDVVAGIEDKIIAQLMEAGEDEASIREILSGE